MAQLIIEDIDTEEEYIYPNGILPKLLPPIGGEIHVYDDEDDGNLLIGGKVVDISFAFSNTLKSEDDYTVIVYVKKEPEG